MKEYKNGNVKINKSFFKSKEDISDFEKILKKLNGNLLYGIEHGRKKTSIYIDKENKEDLCSCSECTLKRHAVVDLKAKIENDYSKDSPKNLIKKAYYHYKLKNLHDALKITQHILDNVDKTKHQIIYSIAQENLIILEKMWFMGSDEFEEERKKIVVQNENKILSQGISSIIGYLKYSKFFDYKFFNLSEDLEKVRGRYNTHNGIGHSHISNIDFKNIIRSSEVFNVISDNGLFFDFYSNIKRFAKLTFKQNLFASKDRVEQLYTSDFIFKITLPHIDVKDYKSFFYELDIKKLNFSNKSLENIYILFKASIDSYSQINQLKEEHPYQKYYRKQIKKIAFLLGYIDIPKSKTNNLILGIYNLPAIEERKRKETIFDSLIKNRISAINKNSAQVYIKSLFNRELDFSFNINNIFALIEKFDSLKLSNAQLEVLLSDNINKETGYYVSYVLYKLYGLVESKIKVKIIDKAHEILNNDSTFNCRLYSLFSREKIISISQEYYDTFLNKVIKAFNKEQKPYYSDSTDREIKNLELLNEFIDHVYEHFDDPYNHLKRFLGRSDYYDFLINPKKLEINEFEIHWFYIAYGKSYFAIKKIISSYKNVSYFIPKKILESKNERYNQAYIDLMRHVNEQN